MLDILAITSPIFLIIALGYVAVRQNIIAQDVARGMGAFVMNFALPALLVKTLSGRPIADIIHGEFLIAYGGGSLIILTIGFPAAGPTFRHKARPVPEGPDGGRVRRLGRRAAR